MADFSRPDSPASHFRRKRFTLFLDLVFQLDRASAYSRSGKHEEPLEGGSLGADLSAEASSEVYFSSYGRVLTWESKRCGRLSRT
jgi:hypothetical protein